MFIQLETKDERRDNSEQSKQLSETMSCHSSKKYIRAQIETPSHGRIVPIVSKLCMYRASKRITNEPPHHAELNTQSHQVPSHLSSESAATP